MKILGSDYDGTFSYGGLRDDKLEAVRRWREAGNVFGIVSGRADKSRVDFLKENPKLQMDFFAGCNGGYVADGDGKVIYECRSELDAKEVSLRLLEWECECATVIGAGIFCITADLDSCSSVPYNAPLYTLDNAPDISYFNQIGARFATEKRAAEVSELIRQTYGGILNPLQNGRYIDIVPWGVNKAEGLRRVAEFFGCKEDDVIAVGDNLNDCDMLSAFRSYAMANGVDEVKALANAIVTDVTEIFEIESK